MRSSGGGQVDWRARIQPLRDQMDAFRDFREELGEQFLSDLQTVLYPEQQELWPSFERVLRRKNLLPMGRLSGENVDLFQVVDQLSLDESARLRIEMILKDYEMQLDEALKRREREQGRANDDIREAIQNGDFDLSIGHVQFNVLSASKAT